MVHIPCNTIGHHRATLITNWYKSRAGNTQRSSSLQQGHFLLGWRNRARLFLHVWILWTNNDARGLVQTVYRHWVQHRPSIDTTRMFHFANSTQIMNAKVYCRRPIKTQRIIIRPGDDIILAVSVKWGLTIY